MEPSDSVQLTKILLLIGLVLFCSVTDFSTRRIPNAVLLPALVGALFLNGLDRGLTGVLDSLLGLGAGLFMLMPLYVLGRMGAGDIKLLGVVGSVLGSWGAVVAGLATMFAGGVLGLLYLLWIAARPGVVACMDRLGMPLGSKEATRTGEVDSASRDVAEIPYAVAIAAGTIATLFYLDLLTGKAAI